MTQNLLFAGTNGHVIAINKRDGKTVWQTSLPSTGFAIVSILLEDGRLFCASGGIVFALNPENGKILWTNKMRSMGQGLVYLATEQSSQGGGMEALAAQAASGTSGTSGTP